MAVLVPPKVSPAFFSYLNEQLSIPVLRQAFAFRTALSAPELFEGVKQKNATRQIALAEFHGDHDFGRESSKDKWTAD